MIDAIQTHLLDILESDLPDLGLTVKRVSDGDDAEQGAVNLFDHVRTENPFRPSVSLGEKENEGQDEPDFEAVNSARVQYRLLKQPLVIICTGENLKAAKAARSSLVGKILSVLLLRNAEAGYWYGLEMGQEKLRQGETSGGAMGQYEAKSTVTLLIRYSRTPSGLAA